MIAKLNASAMPSQSNSGIAQRAIFLLFVAVYLLLFRITYVEDISPVFSYLGMTYNQPSIGAEFAIWVLALAPAGLLPLGLKQPSDFILTLLYISVYIPSIFVGMFMGLRPESELLQLDAALFAGLTVMILILQRPARPYKLLTRNKKTFWVVLWGLYIVCAVWIIAVFKGSLQIVSPSDVYTSGLRFGSRDIFGQSNVGYVVMMMFGAVNPLLIALGLQRRKKQMLIAGICGQVLCYSTGGLKMILVSLVMLFVLHIVMRRNLRRFAQATFLMSGGLLLGCHLWAITAGKAAITTVMMDGMVSRALVIPGQLTAEYHDFFTNHSHLYLSNTKPFSWVIRNPLEDDVILVIGEHYSGAIGVTSNANMWAEEGIANLGLLGIIVISILTAVVLRLVNHISARHEVCFATMAFSYVGFNLVNGPLSTALLSGGLMLSMLLLLLAPPQAGMEPAHEWAQINKVKPMMINNLRPEQS